MKQRLYTLRDKVARKIGSIAISENDETAMRSVQVNSGRDPMLKRCAGDFELVCIGEIDLETGDIIPVMRVVCTVDLLLEGDDSDAS